MPYVDIYSYTFTGQPWIAKEWLSQVLMALAYDARRLGRAWWPLCAAAFGVTSAVLLRLLLRGHPAAAGAAVHRGGLHHDGPALPGAAVRARLPLHAVWVAGLVRAVEERRAPDPMLLVAMLLWANLHGGFTLGLLLSGAFALEA